MVRAALHSSRPLHKRWYLWTLLVLLIAYIVAVVLHWDDRAELWVQEWTHNSTERKASVWLPDYEAVIDAKALPGMEGDEASDITYHPGTRTLFAVMGKNPYLVELSLQGDVLRKMPLTGWSNPEAITTLADGRLAIIDERQHQLTVVKVEADTRELNIADFAPFDLGPSADQNKAFEALAWDPRNQRLLLGEERPPALFSLKLGSDGLPTGEKQRLDAPDLDMRNLSALAVDPRTGHRLLLSADSHLLMEYDETGKQWSFMTLLGGINGLKDTIPRAEGVTMDDEGTIYLVSEPNLFYVLRKR
ncbi:SdiA-regulated domain-containing protein [Pseudomonas sp. CFBP 13710]|uniref:SdiA-regulated domain-containing protein n=1 Tax=Pseudomonas sp. CFBP 13710 TaxID=2775311 RepID=UPI0017808195|nr:SdiA-regulated domain-containing protein [Pseudomonas sp. CFBP 13710]MBD8732751.1 SdiA-regulated domain-containing protein [Pseudomonas sp. CFBP 13710]